MLQKMIIHTKADRHKQNKVSSVSSDSLYGFLNTLDLKLVDDFTAPPQEPPPLSAFQALTLSALLQNNLDPTAIKPGYAPHWQFGDLQTKNKSIIKIKIMCLSQNQFHIKRPLLFYLNYTGYLLTLE